MTQHAAPADEAERLALLHATKLLDTDVAPAFDALTRMATALLACPFAAVNLVDAHRVWSLSRCGILSKQSSRGDSFCDAVIRSRSPVLVNDALQGPPHATLSSVQGEPRLRAYAGLPLVIEGQALGTVCVLDTQPRHWTPAELAHLQDLATNASAMVASQLKAQRARLMEARVRTASLAGSDWLWETNAQGQIQWVSASLVHHTGIDPATEVGLYPADIYTPRNDETRASWERLLQARQRHEPFHDAIADRMTARGRITVSVSGTPVFDSEGQFRGYRGASRNVTRQLAMEQEVKRADVLLRQAIESFHVGVMISQPDGKVVMHNSEWLRNVGESHDPASPYWPDTVRHMYRRGQYGKQALSEDEFVSWRLAVHESAQPLEVPFQNGWLLIKDQVLPDGHVVHFGMDITRQKQDEALLVQKQQALQETEARLSAVLRALPDLWLVFDAEGCYFDAHTEHPMLMRPFEELRGKYLGQAIPAEQAQLQREAMQKAQRTGEPQRLEYSLVTRDGVQRHFEARMTPMPNGHTLFLTRDMTERQVAADKLKASEERWKFALDGAGDGVWDWDVERQRAFFSPQWKLLLGHADAEIPNDIGELHRRVHPDDQARVQASFSRYLQEAEGVYQCEFRMLHKDGHHVWILSRGKVVSTDAKGHALRLVGTHSDITLLKQAESVLREKQSAEAASTAKSEFLSRMSHEIRTPLNAVNGFAQLLQLQMGQAGADATQLNYVAQIRHASQHLMGLVNDVLDLQQVETGLLSFKIEPLSLTEELRQCTDMLSPLAGGRHITLQEDLEAPWPVIADRQRLRQVIMNIGSNAIKYNQMGGTVRFDVVQQKGHMLALTIEDTGPGMSRQQLSRLFQPFERLGRETSNIEGTGLGLIITRSLVDAMGGRLDIRSHPGRGTRVSIVLPRADSPHSTHTLPLDDAPTAVGTPPSQAMLHTDLPADDLQAMRVLYVEDNRINAMLFEEALRPYPQIELDIAEDGQMALSIARNNPPKVLVLDAHLPGMSGFEVLKVLRKVPGLEQVPAYMCSADAMPEDVKRALSEGFTGYWTKPIDIVAVTTELCRLAASGDNPVP